MADLRKIAGRKARKYGIDEGLFFALINQESGWNPRARSPVGATGLTQLMPGTARGLGVNPNNPRQNLEGGAKYLRQQLDAFGGDVRKALAAYNAGPGNVQKYGGVPPFAETQAYVKNIMGAAGGGGRSANAPRSAVGGTGIKLERGTESLTVPDPELLRQQFFAQWLEKKNPQHPLIRFGAVDPDMSTQKTVKIPTVTGFKTTGKGAGGRNPVTGRPGGSYAGTTGIVTSLSQEAKRFRVDTTSGKRDTVLTASGNVSDHAKAKKNANARDWSGAVADMDRWAKHLQKKLGFRDWQGVQTVTKQIDGHVYRFQMIYRTNTGGNHFDHVHLGVERVE